tara:strand:+ start:5485 stop:5628 length:144 start_codon:yes stop_codon:yes gene_type:complete
MAKPTIYKTIDIKSIKNRPTSALSSTESDKAKVVLEKFFELFQVKHF